MTTPLIPDSNSANGTTDGYLPARLLRRMGELEDQVKALAGLEEQVKALTERVASLEDSAAQQAQPRDDLNRKILEFLRQYPGLKFTAHLVAENLNEENSTVYTRLRTLARQGHVTEGKEDGKNRLFHVTAVAN